MVLVDTSVWIRALAGAEPYRAGLDELLSRDEVLGHDFVYGELLVGDRGGRARFLAVYSQMHWAKVVPHEDVVALVQSRKLHGQGVGWVDAHLLASALVDGVSLWTVDDALRKAARALGVGSRNRLN